MADDDVCTLCRKPAFLCVHGEVRRLTRDLHHARLQLGAAEKVLAEIAERAGNYADGAPDAGGCAKECTWIEAIAREALDTLSRERDAEHSR